MTHPREGFFGHGAVVALVTIIQKLRRHRSVEIPTGPHADLTSDANLLMRSLRVILYVNQPPRPLEFLKMRFFAFPLLAPFSPKIDNSCKIMQ